MFPSVQLPRVAVSLIAAAVIAACGGNDEPVDPWQWQAIETVQTDTASTGYSPLVAMAPDGNSAIVVWAQRDGVINNVTVNSLYARRWTRADGWGTAELIETEQLGIAYASLGSMKMDAQGNATVVWQQAGNGTQRVWANRYTVGTGWGTAQALTTTSDLVSGIVRLAVSSAGEATAVWMHRPVGGGAFGIYASRYGAGSWSAPERLDDATGPTYDPDVALDPDANASVVWRQQAVGSLRTDIWTRRHVAGTGWAAASLVETDDTSSTTNPRIVIDGQGMRTVAWEKLSTGTDRQVYVARGAASGTLGAPTRLDTSDAQDGSPRLAVDGQGRVTAAWYRYDATGTGSQQVMFSRLDGSTWSAEAVLAPAAIPDWQELDDLQAASNGDVIVTGYGYSYPSATVSQWTWARRYRAAEGAWQPIQEIVAPNAHQFGYEVEASLSADGQALLVMAYQDATPGANNLQMVRAAALR